MCRLTVSSCCCFSLKTGGYIIGFIDLFFHIVRFVYFQEFRFHADYRLVLDSKLHFGYLSIIQKCVEICMNHFVHVYFYISHYSSWVLFFSFVSQYSLWWCVPVGFMAFMQWVNVFIQILRHNIFNRNHYIDNVHFSFFFAFQKNRHFMLPYLILIIFTVFSLILLVIFLFTTPHYDYYKTARMKQILRDSGLLIHNDLFVIKIVYTFAAGSYSICFSYTWFTPTHINTCKFVGVVLSLHFINLFSSCWFSSDWMVRYTHYVLVV